MYGTVSASIYSLFIGQSKSLPPSSSQVSLSVDCSTCGIASRRLWDPGVIMASTSRLLLCWPNPGLCSLSAAWSSSSAMRMTVPSRTWFLTLSVSLWWVEFRITLLVERSLIPFKVDCTCPYYSSSCTRTWPYSSKTYWCQRYDSSRE